jgi:general L-amino acid transport system permease protein
MWRSWLPQIAVLLALLLLADWLAGNMTDNLHRRGIMVGFDFLGRAARFPISESILAYSPTNSFGWAFLVGLGNTLFISLIVIFTGTLLGLFVGLARRSQHPLASALGSIFVDITRNTPLVVQLLFWYAMVTFGLPRSAEAGNPISGVYLTDRGLYLPRIGIEGPAWPFLQTLLIGIAASIAASAYGRLKRVRTGVAHRYGRIATVLTATAATLVWIVSDLSLSAHYPVLGRFNFGGGMTLTPEFVAVVLGLVLYSAAFIGEIIRGGIDAVPKGQWEAGRSIGLSERHTLRLIVAPQALRVIIPPMTSQYINIIKNSTLALVVGYPELSFVTATMINQTGQAIEGILVLMLVFLSISAGASLLMNWYNRRIALVER